MKKNENKVTNLISNKVAEQLEGIKNAKSTTSKASKEKAKKTKKELVENAQEAAKSFANGPTLYPEPRLLPVVFHLLYLFDHQFGETL